MLVLATRTAEPGQVGELAGQVIRQPGPDLAAELLVRRGQLHLKSSAPASGSRRPDGPIAPRK